MTLVRIVGAATLGLMLMAGAGPAAAQGLGIAAGANFAELSDIDTGDR